MTLNKIKKITGYTNLARFLQTFGLDLTDREVPRMILQPYVSSPTHPIWTDGGRDYIICEVAQRKYEVFVVENY